MGGSTWPTAQWGSPLFDSYVVQARATLSVSAAGVYTLGASHDDGGRLRIDLNNNGSFDDPGLLSLLQVHYYL